MDNSNKNSVRVLALIALVLVGGGAVVYTLMGKKTEVAPTTTQEQTQTSTATLTDTSVSTTASSNSAYRDGTYTATGSYMSPGGTEQLDVTLTLKDGVVTAASITPKPVSHEGVEFQNIFAQNFKQYVIGKDISSIKLTNVSGSSLTPIGFNDAVAKIEAQAKA